LLNWNSVENFAFRGEKYTSRVRNYPEITGHMPITVLQDEILTPGEGQIRALWVNGCNPLRTYTNSTKMEKAFKGLELLVSVDPFLTEVGRLAHYVLPSCSYHEQDNISFQFEHIFPTRFVQLTQKIREPLGDSRPEWKIFTDLTRKMGLNFMGNPVLSKGFDLADWIAGISGNKGGINRQNFLLKMLARLGGTSFAELEAKPHGFSLDNGRSKDMLAEIRMPGGKARLDVPEFLESVSRLALEAPKQDPAHPFILCTSCRDLGNVNTLYRNEKWIEGHMPENKLVMNPKDAQELNVSGESRVRVISKISSSDAALALSEDAMPGTLYLKGGWGLYSRDPKDNSGALRGTAAANFVPDEDADEHTGMPFLSGIPVRVEKIPG
jgi:anaerobic selenocysteine-containing dehydrogenase